MEQIYKYLLDLSTCLDFGINMPNVGDVVTVAMTVHNNVEEFGVCVSFFE